MNSATRMANLKRLIEDRFHGSPAEFSRASGVSLSQLGQWESGYRNLGEKAARRIEQALHLAEGFLDGPAGAAGELVYSTEAPDPICRIPQLDVRASMGSGIVVPAHDEVVCSVQVGEQPLRRLLGNAQVSSLANLRLITAYGDSMSPTFSDGDVLLVDTGVAGAQIDAVYVMAYRDELFIKRLQRLPGGVLRMLSDNRVYDPVDIANGQREEFRVLGRVLLAWNARKL